MIDRTAVVLAGGESKEFGCDRGLVKLVDKPLILHVIDRIRSIVDEVIVCLKSSGQIPAYSQILPGDSKIVVDEEGLPQCPLSGAYTGLMKSEGKYTSILPYDTPFVSTRLMDLLFELAMGVDATIPRWPNNYVEPLQAVYKTNLSLEAARKALKRGNYDMRAIIPLLRRVRYISTLVVREIDPKMHTFININTPLDLKRAEMLIRKGSVT